MQRNKKKLSKKKVSKTKTSAENRNRQKKKIRTEKKVVETPKTQKMSNNLNSLMNPHRGEVQRSIHGTEYVCYNISDFLTRKLSLCDEAFICTPYLSSTTPLYEAFSKLQKTTIVTSYSKTLKTKTYKTMFSEWNADVFTLNVGSGKKKSIAHSKYVIGLKQDEIIFVTTGSYNITGGSDTNIENIVCFNDIAMKQFITNEYLNIKQICKQLY